MSPADANVGELFSDVDGLLNCLQASFACSLYPDSTCCCESPPVYGARLANSLGTRLG